jgi:hypothetical protein
MIHCVVYYNLLYNKSSFCWLQLSPFQMVACSQNVCYVRIWIGSFPVTHILCPVWCALRHCTGVMHCPLYDINPWIMEQKNPLLVLYWILFVPHILVIIFSTFFFLSMNPRLKDKNRHHKHPGLGHLACSVSRVTVALSIVSSVSQLFSFLVGCSGMILKGFGFVTFFAGVKASSFCIHLSCLVCSLPVVHGVWSHLFLRFLWRFWVV